MSKKTEKSRVSIRPSEFSSSPDLLNATMEEAVALSIDKERQRHKMAKDDENQQECIVGCRVVPTGLILALDTQADRLGISRALLTRCLSHQVMAWFESQQRISDLVNVFNTARSAANDFGYPDLYDDALPAYSFANTSPKSTTFRTIQWVKNSLAQISRPLYAPTNALFAIGLCSSLSRAADGGHGTTEKYLVVEVSKFLSHVEEQFITVSGFHDRIRRRARMDGKITENTP